jgi:hypothetical protein
LAGFLYNSEKEFDDFNAGLLPEAAYLWLTELALHKVSRFPSLNAICVEEKVVSRRGDPPLPYTVWHPEPIIAFFESYGIKLDVRMRGTVDRKLDVRMRRTVDRIGPAGPEHPFHHWAERKKAQQRRDARNMNWNQNKIIKAKSRENAPTNEAE